MSFKVPKSTEDKNNGVLQCFPLKVPFSVEIVNLVEIVEIYIVKLRYCALQGWLPFVIWYQCGITSGGWSSESFTQVQ